MNDHNAAQPAAPEPGSVAENPYNATLLERVDHTPALSLFRFGFNDHAVPDFEPGQYTTLGFVDPVQPDPASRPRRRGPKLMRRTYSIASSPKEKSHLAFYVVHVEHGRFTTPLWQLQPGDPIFMDHRIKGTFTLEGVPDGKDLVMVSTGTGLAPFVSMLDTYRGTGRWRNFILLDGCRHVSDLGYYDHLTRIAAEDATVQYLPTVTREPADAPWAGLRGRVHGILKPDNFTRITGLTLNPQTCHIFLCGRPEMIDEASANMIALGFTTKDHQHPDGNLHFERYW